MASLESIKVLDGSVATQLLLHAGTEKFDGHPLWTSKLLATNPEAVYKMHLDYLHAGSNIIKTNTYQASVPGFIIHLKLNEEESLNLIRSAVELAKRAVNVYKEETKNTRVSNKEPLIAGSVGSYAACLNNCSEYNCGRYDENVTKDSLREWHRPRITALLDAGVDLLAIETIPSGIEAEALSELLLEFPNVKAWISFSVRTDGKHLVDGTNFKEIALQCYKTAKNNLVAIGVNCLAPRLVTSFLSSLHEAEPGIPLVTYPNSGEVFTDSKGWQKDETFHPPEEFIEEWLNLGVKYIGTCCRTGTKEIKGICEKGYKSQQKYWGHGLEIELEIEKNIT